MIGAKIVGNTRLVAWSLPTTSSLRSRVRLPPGRDDRSRRLGETLGGEGGLMTITINHFHRRFPALHDRSSGCWRRNFLVVLMSVELI
jgi:hypothetical protein